MKMKFEAGQYVEKFSGDYTGPGVIVTADMMNGNERYVVGHRIIGGTGMLLHIYGPNNIRLLQKWSDAPPVTDEAHRAARMLLGIKEQNRDHIYHVARSIRYILD